MKNIIITILMSLIIFSMKVYGNYNGINEKEFILNRCETEVEYLLEEVQKKGNIRVSISLDLDDTSLKSISEAERRKIVKQKQDEFIFISKGRNISFIQKLNRRPRLAMSVDKKALEFLIGLPMVKKITLERPDKPHLNESIQIVQANDVWDNLGVTGEGQTIVILDTGVDYEHEFFGDRVVNGACFSTNDPNYNSTSLCPNEEEEQFGVSAGVPCDGYYGCDHGTHVAGIAAGSETNDMGSGVALDANIISVQVFSLYNGSLGSFPFDQERALEWIYDIRDDYEIASVNMSLGGGEHTSPCDNDNRAGIIGDLADVGIVTIAASGNEGYEDAMSAPACIPSVISVGATNKDDIHSSSSNAAPFLDLTAPGSSIYSSIPGDEYASYSGTSMAAPHVAGTVALMKSASPDLTFTEIRNHLHNSADKVDGMGNRILLMNMAMVG